MYQCIKLCINESDVDVYLSGHKVRKNLHNTKKITYHIPAEVVFALRILGSGSVSLVGLFPLV